jgi:hypothetical protein
MPQGMTTRLRQIYFGRGQFAIMSHRATRPDGRAPTRPGLDFATEVVFPANELS